MGRVWGEVSMNEYKEIRLGSRAISVPLHIWQVTEATKECDDIISSQNNDATILSNEEREWYLFLRKEIYNHLETCCKGYIAYCDSCKNSDKNGLVLSKYELQMALCFIIISRCSNIIDNDSACKKIYDMKIDMQAFIEGARLNSSEADATINNLKQRAEAAEQALADTKAELADINDCYDKALDDVANIGADFVATLHEAEDLKQALAEAREQLAAAPQEVVTVNAALWEESCKAACVVTEQIAKNRERGITKAAFLGRMKAVTPNKVTCSGADRAAWKALPDEYKNGPGCPKK